MEETEEKKSFVMYDSFLKAAEGLSSDKEFREFMICLKDYALYHVETPSESPMVSMLMVGAKQLLDSARKNHDKKKKAREQQ